MPKRSHRNRDLSLRTFATALFVGGLLLSAGQAPAENPSPPIKSSLIVFGDSLSDSGNAFALTGGIIPPSPPYAGRFSNGPLWTEYLAQSLDLDVDLEATLATDPLAANQAVGGAFTDTRNLNGWHPALTGTGIQGQVAQFEEAGGRIKPKDVVILWGGANNYIFDPTGDVEGAVDDLVRAAEGLADLGARRLIVPNLPDLGRTPLALADPPVAAVLTGLTGAHNTLLDARMAELADDEGLEIRVLDIRTAFETLLDNPLVLPNKALPCLGAGAAPTGACAGPPYAFTPEQTVFWDPLHPTTVAHSLLALFALGVITDDGIALSSLAVRSGT